MKSSWIMKGMLGFYILLFFGYLFGPLMVMGITAFNTPAYPQAYPFEAFTLDWFVKLWNHRAMMEGLWNSIIIGLGVVALSVPAGLAAAIIMSQIYHRARGLFYLVTVSPLLTPGVIIGISTVIFWRDLTTLTGMKFFYNGIFLATVGQATFISAYCMLIFLSRLQRFDRQDLNQDPEFARCVTTGENLVRVIWNLLVKAAPAELQRIRLGETQDVSFEYSG